MDHVKRKVLIDLFGSPLTVLPMVGGVTALFASWALGGNAIFNFAGVTGILGGLGVLASRLIVGLEDLTDRAYQYVVAQRRSEREAALDALDRKLRLDKDPRPEGFLHQLRKIYAGLEQYLQQRQSAPGAYEVLDGVDRLFHVCVAQLDQTHALWEASRVLPQGAARTALERQREELIGEVQETVQHLGQAIERFYEVATRRSRTDLAELRQELDETIRVARRVEERAAELGAPRVRDAASAD